LQHLLTFPTPGSYRDDFFMMKKNSLLYWNPSYLSYSTQPFEAGNQVHHLYYFSVTIFSWDRKGMPIRRRYEYEDIYINE
jgi:hypothetical protein